MLAKLLTLSFVLTVTNVSAQEDTEEYQIGDDVTEVKDIFHRESDFMRGFETGLFLRSKQGSVEDYGCVVPTEGRNKMAKSAFDQIKMSINMAKSKLKVDPIVDNAMTLIVDFLDSTYSFLAILQPKQSEKLDQYCTGMIFGLEGSKLLVKVANTLINPMDKDGKAKKTFGGKKKGSGILGALGGLGSLAEGIMNTAQDSFKMADKDINDEL